MTNSQPNKIIKLLVPFALAALVSACGSSDGGISGTGDPIMVTDPVDQAAPGETISNGTETVTDNDTGNSTDSGNESGNGTDTDNSASTDNNSDNASAIGDETTSVISNGSSGPSDTATPKIAWTAVDGADSYQLVLTEAEGNQITYNASTAACDGTSCSATPTAAFHNNSIDWQVNAITSGNIIQTAASGSYTTARSFELTPVTSDEARCSVWPSIAYEDIIVLNNIWNAGQVRSNAWTQKIAATESDVSRPVASWSYDWLTEADGDRTAVKAYPEVIYGNKLGTHVSATTARTGLPATANQLPEFEVEFAYTETLEGDVERNVALESFFHDSCDITGPCDLIDNRAYEMMVWVANPESNRPGDLAVSGVMIDNRLWDVYIKPRSDKKYIAFTAQTPFSEGTLQWNRFVEWTMQWTAENAEALNINALKPELCMAAIEMGTELWWGKGSFTLDQFNVTRNQ